MTQPDIIPKNQFEVNLLACLGRRSQIRSPEDLTIMVVLISEHLSH